MRVRLKQASEVPATDASGAVSRLWLPAGAECDLPDALFDANVHEDITPPAPPAPAPAP